MRKNDVLSISDRILYRQVECLTMRKEGDTQTFRIPIELSGKRADVAFSHLLSGLTRSQIRKLIDERLILVEGKPLKPSKKLSGGEMVSVTLPPPEPLEAEPQDIPVTILYEDDDIVVVDKPAGMTVHPGAGVPDGTLVNALLYRCKGLSGIGGKIRPGIVHRLDKDTSGVMVVAKNDFAHQALINQFKSRKVKKKYLALVVGDIKGESGSFSSHIGRHPINRIKMSTKAKTGKEALTLWKVIKRYRDATLVEAEPKTGRTHQIRVHFAENRYPLLGDRIYGPRKHKSEFLETASKALGRQALHASTIGFTHPRTDEYMEFHAPLPDDMKKAINILERYTNELG
jgi:23S rRNA pseudouridine1911/1915/1917 synthase